MYWNQVAVILTEKQTQETYAFHCTMLFVVKTYWNWEWDLAGFQVLGSDTEWHFVHPGLSHARTRRSLGHHIRLKRDLGVSLYDCILQTKLFNVSHHALNNLDTFFAFEPTKHQVHFNRFKAHHATLKSHDIMCQWGIILSDCWRH